ncbi:CxxxxCH/CxxCH domain-containing protein [Geobacter pelophilus]|uniref:CxxxxCH/CxxCH domain-containing protein n=1 Tax=Geoanaerobacter pelophilus TaxID=60036 RepID=A0AAW4LB95_9BACT|nr:CxxxxCH/CxxCH domain-containing protein [Geoanaerobacter pelophilus]MBT0665661.1 CxxxxCH/CxxCH domain-containing protein [Geoanaerobacter pelophilus]
MSIRQIYFILTATLLALSLQGCGSSNDKAPSISAAGAHPADWFTGHRQAYFDAYALDKAAQCRDCHGSDLMGGITKVGCSTTSCHAGGHAPRVVHSLPFKAASLHGPAALADIAGCGACHATSTAPVSNPRFNIAIGSLTNGCEECHKTGTAHPPVDPAKVSGYPSSWNNHATAGNIANSCTLCHGLDYNGGSGPSCRNCHNVLGAAMPPVAGQCISCHAKPPATGGHAAHNAVASLLNLCTACHFGAANGTVRHGSRGFANVSTAIPVGFNAKTGSARVTPTLTCQNVSCHGGVTTPPWATGSINVATQCEQCHISGTASQTPQYNSFWSGEHAKHVTEMHLPCTDCHDMSVTNGSNSHFSNMATPAFELTPALTIRGPVNYSGGSCSPGNNPAQFSIGVCHGSKNW